MTDLTDFGRLVPREHGLIVVSTLRADGTIQSSVVNAGVLSHPFTGQPAVGFVVRGGTRKLDNLRARPRATVVIRAGWEWAAAEGPVELVGPDDPASGVDAERLRLLLREIFAAAGGTHDDWDTYDKVMAQERRAAVLLSPDRVYSNPSRLSPARAAYRQPAPLIASPRRLSAAYPPTARRRSRDMQTEHAMIALADGRAVEVLSYGPADGLPLVTHHGTPGGGLATYQPTIDTEMARGLRTIQFARPGYGQSAPHPGRRVADVAADVAEFLDALDVETFITWGRSGGGPHALACAALLPGRCLAAASIAGVAPRDADGLDWIADMGPENVAEISAAEGGSAELTAFLEKDAAGLATVTGADIIEGLGGLIGEADKAVLTGEYADYQAESFRAALRRGIAGWYEDDMAFVTPWGFPLSGDLAPVAVWQGDQDRMVPFGHGQWLAGHIPGARAHLLPGEGHLSLAEHHYGEILDDLIALVQSRG
jgi:PPOX class probable F420-dependent enzyme